MSRHLIHFEPARTAPDTLAFALDGAAHAVAAVRAGSALPVALAAVFRQIEALAARGAIQDLACRTLRALGRADALAAALMRKPPVPRLDSLIVCALALLSETVGPSAYAAYTIVDQAVQAAGARRQWQHAKGFVNAVLRHFLRVREQMLASVLQNPVARWNYPYWWIDAVRAAWPSGWEDILAVGNTHAPMTVRVNVRRMSRAAYLERLSTHDIPACPVGECAVQLIRPRPVEQLPGFKEGVASVQDAGAQRAAPLLNVRNGLRVLDACAAPGGKTGHLLELADLELVALDIDRLRAARIDANLQRLQLHATVCVGDACQPEQWWDGRLFDRILVDAPCSGSGVVRRHPDLRWLRRADDIAALAKRQRQLLAALWPLLKTGGELLYSTCSIFPAEGEAQARAFEATVHDALRLPALGQLLPSAGSAELDHDGFFYARFLKR